MLPTRTSAKGVMIVVCAIAGTQATPADLPPPPQLFDGRYYEVVLARNITWEAAKTAAEARTYGGVQGQLATLVSADEDAFVHQLRQSAVTGDGELWAGAYQTSCSTSNPEPACGWLWTNGEPISPVNTATPYTNWLAGEPNNGVGIPGPATSENHLTIGRDGAFGWNDQGRVSNIRGYVVEYGDKVTIDPNECTADLEGCNLAGAQILKYPRTARVANDATLTAHTFRIRDDSGRCERGEPLSLFNGAVVIPPYLCGHPDFLVIETDATGVEVLSGSVLVENLTEDVLPGNEYGCTSTLQNPAGVTDPDPSHRDVVAWQSSDSADMIESDPTLATGRYAGTLAEVTYDCGSSRGKIISGSYHFVGLHIYPGAGNEYAESRERNHASFVDLIRYKLEVLRASVRESQNAMPGASYVALKAHVDDAIRFHSRRQYGSALSSIRQFLKKVGATAYEPVPGENFSGEHLMRGSNLEFMYVEKLIPYAP